MKRAITTTAALLIASNLLAPAAEEDVLTNRALLALLKPLPEVVDSKDNPVTEEKVQLGRKLFHDTRLSLTRKNSCNSCHNLETYGVDNQQFSTGDAGGKGGRNSPSVFNAAVHISQFWDGRAKDVEEQAKGPVLNPVEMAMPDAEYVIKVLKSIPGYVDEFAKAFPADKDPISYDNFGKAVGAFERKLMTPSRIDTYLKGDESALTADELGGLNEFLGAGCATCHNGPAIGGQLYQKLGLVKPWPELKDTGRHEVTKKESDKYLFKVPSLRNTAKTGPYLHDGSIKDLKKLTAMMAEHQLGRTLDEKQVESIVTFLKTLTGELPKDLIAKPELPADGPETPKPKKDSAE
jgi:cytochrome c peroxidase